EDYKRIDHRLMMGNLLPIAIYHFDHAFDC
ncbi:hypothetical protein S1OALGB6SA_375, partial [Olavius algarvensis spirochete endosymbiont]